jgi:hypothetical protein
VSFSKIISMGFRGLALGLVALYGATVASDRVKFELALLFLVDGTYHQDSSKELYIPRHLLQDLEDFVVGAEKHQVRLNQDPLIVIYSSIIETQELAGLCFKGRGEISIILLSDSYRKKSFDRKSLLFHELAHCMAGVSQHQGMFGGMFSEYTWPITEKKSFDIHAEKMFNFLREFQQRENNISETK